MPPSFVVGSSSRRGGRSGSGTPRPGWAAGAPARRPPGRARRAAGPRPGSSAGSLAGAVTRPVSARTSGAVPVNPATTRRHLPGLAPGPAARTTRVWPPVLAFSSAGVPRRDHRPRSMTAIWSASSSASSRYWVVSRTVAPPATTPRIVSHTWPRARGSRPVVGSSRKSTCGSPTRLAARSSRAPHAAGVGLAPPARPRRPVRTAPSSSPGPAPRAAARLKPSSRPIIIRFSVPVSSSSTEANWPVSAISWRTCTASVSTSYPQILACPASGFSRVASTRTAVVLPAPFGPSRARTLPRSAARSTPASAWVLPKRLVSPSASMT